MYKIAVLTHIYYDGSYDFLKNDLLNFNEFTTDYLFNISIDCAQKDKVIESIQTDFPNAFIIETPNIGKDIGGKLALIDLYLRLKIQSDYMILLHDKVSPQALNGEEWRDKLLKITKKDTIKTILGLFKSDTSIGVIANQECILNEYSAETNSFSTVNNDLLKASIAQYNIKPTHYSFIAGTMFWVKSNIIKDFFSKHPPLEMRKKLEHGNVLDNLIGTYTHTTERLFGLIAESQGYKIKGV